MTTEQGNKLIAEFMGGTLDSPGSPYYYFLEKGKYETELKYHSSWDWLMPVVEKIETLNNSCTLVIIEDERCHIDTQNGFELDSVGCTKIEATYNAVVRFIEWYNNK